MGHACGYADGNLSFEGENSMATQAQVSGRKMSVSLNAGANIVALAGVGLIGYGVMFLIRNFTGFTELGLTADQVGGTPG
jgi:hypothetical protein